MLTNLATRDELPNPDLLVAAGCPFSGWEMALEALQQLSMQPTDGVFAEWLQKVFQQYGSEDPFVFDSPLPADLTPPKLENETASPWLSADSRNVHLLDFWAKHLPGARFALFYTSPETGLASALSQGLNPETFLSGWHKTNRLLMGFQRRHRDRTLMFDAETVSLCPDAFAEACNRIGMRSTSEEGNAFGETTFEVGSLERLIARQWLAQDKSSETLQYELEACAIPLGKKDDTSREILADASEQYLRWRANDEREKKRQEELAELGIVQKASLQRSAKQHDQDQKNLYDLRAQFERVAEEAETLQANKAEVEQENDLLLLQLHQVQEELETVFLSQPKLEAERDSLREKLKELEVRQGQAIAQAESLTEAKSEAEQESELLLLQLHQVQEELEHYFLLYQKLSGNGLAEESQGEKVAGEGNVEAVEGSRSGTSSSQRGRNTKDRRKDKKLLQLLKKSGLFDAEWYLAVYTDVAEAKYDPIKHYLRFGAVEGRDPSPHFSTRFYLQSYPDVEESGMNPLVHYINYGREEGRQPK